MSRLRATPRGDLSNVIKASPGIGRALGLLTDAGLTGPSPLSMNERLEIVKAALLEPIADRGSPNKVIAPLVTLAHKLAHDPRSIDDADLDNAFDAGWDDAAVVHAVLIAGLTGLIDRLVIALDLAREPRLELMNNLIRLASEGYAAAEMLVARD